MRKLLLALDALRKGSMLADPALWKNRSAAIIAITAVVAVLLKILKAYGYEIPLNDEDIAAIAGTIVTLVSLYFTYSTSDKVGVFPSKPDASDGVQPGGSPEDASKGSMSGPN